MNRGPLGVSAGTGLNGRLAPRLWRQLFPDNFVPILLATLIFAALVPVRGAAADWARWAGTSAIITLFFLNGVRLARHQLIAAARNLRLTGGSMLFCFGVMPLCGWGLMAVTAPWVPPPVALGFLFCAILPSTVQSATAATAMAGGNVAASVTLAALLNLVGVAASPLLLALLGGPTAAIHGDALVRILAILVAPFVLGQLCQPWLHPAVTARPLLVRWLDRGAIAVAVYIAFSAAVVGGVGGLLGAAQWSVVGGGIASLLAIGYGGAWALARALRLAPGDRISLTFAGAQKSVAVGAPLAAALFAPAAAGMVLVVTLCYHMLQLMVAGWLAPMIGGRRDIVE